MNSSIKFNGQEVRNPVLRVLVGIIAFTFGIMAFVFGILGFLLMMALFPFAYVLHSLGCPGIWINGGKPIGRDTYILKYQFR